MARFTTPTSPSFLESCNDRLRVALFFLIPIYTRLYLSSHEWAALDIITLHLAILCAIYYYAWFLKPISVEVDPDVWKIISKPILCAFPVWVTYHPALAWLTWGLEGWRWEVVYWMIALRTVVIILPETYGQDILAIETWNKFHDHRRNGMMPKYSAIAILCIWAALFLVFLNSDIGWTAFIFSAITIIWFTGLVVDMLLQFKCVRMHGMTLEEHWDTWEEREKSGRFTMSMRLEDEEKKIQ
ncbi:hypothetical protein P280DRAFT_547872 [Massarina eburnea CBS 473.64]|uniref:Uncharacterized protein n=1 Tax=Massarina eburnea CBS 473.64 TaxID=1395130 RepID=A0A6A6S6M0_9PLEO|nr:hypothetical protein P280DRAFT_547872 [Massarina eburnea CBS 473.64]